MIAPVGRGVWANTRFARTNARVFVVRVGAILVIATMPLGFWANTRFARTGSIGRGIWGEYKIRRYGGIVLVRFPLAGIADDVFRDTIQFVIISNDVFIVVALPQSARKRLPAVAFDTINI